MMVAPSLVHDLALRHQDFVHAAGAERRAQGVGDDALALMLSYIASLPLSFFFVP